MDVGLGVRCEQTGLYMDTRTDKIIKPNKNYFHSKMWFKEREDTTLYVQCHIRAWFARRRANNLRKIRDEKDAELRRKQEELRLEEERKRKEEIDFAITLKACMNKMTGPPKILTGGEG